MKQIIPICFKKTNTKQIQIPHSPLLKPAPTDLYAEIRGGFQKIMIPLSDSWSQNDLYTDQREENKNTNNTDITNIKDFTIYRG